MLWEGRKWFRNVASFFLKQSKARFELLSSSTCARLVRVLRGEPICRRASNGSSSVSLSSSSSRESVSLCRSSSRNSIRLRINSAMKLLWSSTRIYNRNMWSLLVIDGKQTSWQRHTWLAISLRLVCRRYQRLIGPCCFSFGRVLKLRAAPFAMISSKMCFEACILGKFQFLVASGSVSSIIAM